MASGVGYMNKQKALGKLERAWTFIEGIISHDEIESRSLRTLRVTGIKDGL